MHSYSSSRQQAYQPSQTSPMDTSYLPISSLPTLCLHCCPGFPFLCWFCCPGSISLQVRSSPSPSFLGLSYQLPEAYSGGLWVCTAFMVCASVHGIPGDCLIDTGLQTDTFLLLQTGPSVGASLLTPFHLPVICCLLGCGFLQL